MLSEMVEIAEEALRLARAEELDTRVQHLSNHVLTPLEENEIAIAFLGEFSVGKSSLLNALFSENVLPVAVRATTSLVTEIRGGEQAYFLEREREDILLSRDRFRALASGEETGQPGDVLRIFLNSPMLEDSTCFVDTPGVQSMNAQHEDITYGYLPRVDAACIVLDATRGEIPRSVMSFLKDQILASDVGKLVFVLNKIDEVPPDEREAVERKVRSTLAPIIPTPVLTQASAAQGEHEVDTLTAILSTQIIPARKELLQHRVWGRLRGELGSMIGELEVRREALSSDDEEIIRRIEALKELREETRRSSRRTREELKQDIARISSDLPDLVQRAMRRVSDRAIQEIRQVNPTRLGELDLQRKIQGWVAQEVDVLVQQELSPRLHQLGDRVRNDFTKFHQRLQHEVSIKGALEASRAKSSPLADLIVEGALIVALNVILPGEWIIALLGRVVGAKFLERITGPLTDLVRTFLGQAASETVVERVISQTTSSIQSLEPGIVSELQKALRQTEESLIREVQAHLDETLDTHEASMERARTERQQREDELLASVNRIDAVIKELRGLLRRAESNA